MRRERGQTATETIVAIVLIALTAVIVIGLYGRTAMSKFLCAARAVASGDPISACGQSGAEKGRGTEDSSDPAKGVDGKGRESGARPRAGGSGGTDSDDPPDRLRRALDILAAGGGRSRRLARSILNDVDVRFDSGPGTFFNTDPSSGRPTITLADRSTTDDILFSLAHEGNHADFERDGRTADARQMSLDDFVDKMLDEEVASVMAEIELKKELEAPEFGGHTFSPLPFGVEEAFDAAFDQKLEELRNTARREGKRFHEANARAEAKKAGAAAVKRKFTGDPANGIPPQITNSIDGRPYTEYYRDEYYRIVHGAGEPHLRLP